MEQRFKTIKEIRNWWYADEGSQYSFSSLLTYVEKSIGDSPEKPIKPILSQKHTANLATEYAEKLGEYESLLPEYNKKFIQFVEVLNLNNKLIEELIKDESEFYRFVPEIYQDRVISYAYQQGHSGDFSEIYAILCDLVKIFE